MQEWIDIIDFNLVHEAHIAKSKLESENIVVNLKDEHISSVGIPGAVGGVKLQIRSADLDRAIEILEESGYNLNRNNQPSPTIIKLEQFTSQIPILNKAILEVRLMVLFGIISTIILLLYIEFG
ncbi:MAG: hypothetical protein ACI959_001055 [Limisphaerales bacterium]|jgi:hypothetical protein